MSIARALTLSILLAGQPLAAQDLVCDGALAEPVPAFELVKDHFLHGRYPEFFAAATPYVDNRDAMYDQLIGPLAKLMPDGFAGCATAVQRREAPGMVQEITLFDVPGTGPLSLYLVGLLFRGEVSVMLFTYNSDVEAALENLR